MVHDFQNLYFALRRRTLTQIKKGRHKPPPPNHEKTETMKGKNTKHLKQRCINVINSCATLYQLKSAMNYAKLANVDNDKVVLSWYQFKYNLIGNI